MWRYSWQFPFKQVVIRLEAKKNLIIHWYSETAPRFLYVKELSGKLETEKIIQSF